MLLHHAKCAGMKIIAAPLPLWFLSLLWDLDNRLRIAAHRSWGFYFCEFVLFLQITSVLKEADKSLLSADMAVAFVVALGAR